MGQVTTLRQPPNIVGVPAAEVFDRHHADVYRYLARRVPADIADDLASETFVRALERDVGVVRKPEQLKAVNRRLTGAIVE